MPDLTAALARRDAVLDTILALKEWAPMTRQRTSLNIFMIKPGHQEKAMPMKLREAQAEVLRLLDETA